MTFSSLEDSISLDNPIRFIDAFEEHSDLEALAFVDKTLLSEGLTVVNNSPTLSFRRKEESH